MKSLMAALAVIMLAACPSQAAADEIDVSGHWTLTIETPRGSRAQEVEFIQTGEDLRVIPQAGEHAPSEGAGTVKGDKIAWSWKIGTPRGEMTITFTGTVSGDSMSGTLSRPSGEGKWSAKRMEAENPA
jgi:hypothetical protein